MDKKVYNTYVSILKNELVVALGCTEPIAIAYAGAKVREVLEAMPDRCEINCSGNIVKNVKGVTVPNSGGMKGIDTAATLGIVGGNVKRILAVLEDITPEQIETTQKLVKEGFCSCGLIEGVENLYIIITAYAGEESATVEIRDYHSNITKIVKNGKIIFSTDDEQSEQSSGPDKSLLNVKDILEFADCVDLSDISEVISRQIECNTAISQEGLNNPWGAQVGRTLLDTFGSDVAIRAKAAAAAGSDARMSGCPMPVVINSGSGNQGITVSVPVIVYAKELHSSAEELYRALLVSNLIAIHLKNGIGPLSAFCGAVCAGCAAGCGIAWLQGGRLEDVSHTLVNSIAIVSGIVCDGAKPSCAGKIASSVDAGILGYSMFQEGQQFYAEDGIVSQGVENTIRNIYRLGAKGMCETDEEIIRIMTHCD